MQAVSRGPDQRLPLRGVRVLDLGMVWAGPQAATLLADLGADVVKVEGPTHPDPFRAMFGAADPGLFPEDDLLEWSPLFCSLNRNKRGIALDLRDPSGVERCRALAAAADVFLDNFSARVLPRLGLAHADLRRANARLITCSMSGFGRTGLYRDAISYGPMVEQLSGALALSGYPDVGPVGLASAFDAIAGCHGALAIVAALVGRSRTGHAADIDLAQMESGPPVTGAYVADRQLGHPPFVRDGNADPVHAPHRMYPCAGDDQWVAIAVRDDGAFAALASTIGHPELADDPRLATAAARKQHEAEVDGLVAGWTAQRTADDAAAALQAAAVVAAPLRSVREAMAEPRLRDAGEFAVVERVPNGPREYLTPPIDLDGARLRIRRPSPRLGEHTDEVLEDWSKPEPEALPVGAPAPPGLAVPAAGAPPLDGVSVLVRGRSDAVAVCARLLCDLGAAVWRDPMAVDAGRRRTPGARLYFGTGMRDALPPDSVHIVVDDAGVADAVPDGTRIAVAVDDVAGGWQLDDLTACALSSLSWRIGDPGREPLQPGRGYPSHVAGALAALAAVALLLDALRGSSAGTLRTARVSLLGAALMMSTFDTTVVSFGGEPPPRNRRPWPSLTFACRDGWVGIFPRTDEMWESLCAMTDRTDLLADPRLATFAGRQAHSEFIREAMAPWFAAHGRAEADAAAHALRVPLAVVCDPLDVLEQPSFQERGLFVPVEAEDGRQVLVPGLPYLLDGVRRGPTAVTSARTPR